MAGYKLRKSFKACFVDQDGELHFTDNPKERARWLGLPNSGAIMFPSPMNRHEGTAYVEQLQKQKVVPSPAQHQPTKLTSLQELGKVLPSEPAPERNFYDELYADWKRR